MPQLVRRSSLAGAEGLGAGLVVGVGGGFQEGEDRGDAGVGAFEEGAPLVAGPGAELAGQALPQERPGGLVELGRGVVGGQADPLEELGPELGLEGADGQVAGVGGLVDGVEGGGAVEQVGATAVGPEAGGEQLVELGGEQRGPVGHGRVDHLAPAGAGRLQQGGDHAEGEQHPAAAEVAEQVERRHRGAVGRADRVQRPGQGDVVDVVAGRTGQGTVLAPAGDPAVDQAGVAGQAGLGPDPEPLGHPGAEPLDQRVGPGGQVEHHPRPVGVLEVDGDPAPSPAEQGRPPWLVSRRAVDGQDLGAQVGQEHGAERPRPDRGQLDHPHSLQGTHARIVGSGGADEGGEAWLTSASTTGWPL
jgi:hypothetical protein